MYHSGINIYTNSVLWKVGRQLSWVQHRFVYCWAQLETKGYHTPSGARGRRLPLVLVWLERVQLQLHSRPFGSSWEVKA